MNSSNDFSEMMKIKRENFRNEIRKSELNSMMHSKRIREVVEIELSQSEYDRIYKENEGVNIEETILNLVKSLMDRDYRMDTVEIVKYLQVIRKISSNKIYTPGKELIKSGILTYLNRYLTIEFVSIPRIQIEAIWIICNITSVNDIGLNIFFECDIVKNLISLLMTENIEVYFNVIWALANISGDSSDFRDHLIILGIIDNLIQSFQRFFTNIRDLESIKCMREVVWLMSNICRGKPYPPYSQIRPFVEIFTYCLSFKDFEINEHSLWGLYYLSDGENYKIKNIMKQNCLDYIIELTTFPDIKIKTPALRIIGSGCLSDDNDVKELLDRNLLFSIKLNLENSKNKFVKKETCWIFGNICAGNAYIINRIIDDRNGLLPIIRDMVLHEENIIRIELITAFCNLTQNSTLEQILFFIDQDLIYILINGLELGDPKTILNILDAIDNLLNFNKINELQEKDHIYNELEKYECGKILEKLQEHPEQKIYSRIYEIIEKHYSFA